MILRVLPLQGAFALASANRFVPQEDFRPKEVHSRALHSRWSALHSRWSPKEV
jgi:hypothetical protein